VLQLGTLLFLMRRQWDGGTLNLVVVATRTSLLINNVDNTSDTNKIFYCTSCS
jgi:hypothetical protein